MKHLLVTNDFPPKIGGIQSLLWEWWRRLPADRFAVLTSPHADAAAFDAEQPYRIERTREPVLLPHPWMVRRIDAMAVEVSRDLTGCVNGYGLRARRASHIKCYECGVAA